MLGSATHALYNVIPPTYYIILVGISLGESLGQFDDIHTPSREGTKYKSFNAPKYYPICSTPCFYYILLAVI